MRLLYVADGRSPIALGWIRHFVERGHEVFLASTFPCSPPLAIRELQVIPVAFSGSRGHNGSAGGASISGIRFRSRLRHLLGPLTIPRAARRLRTFAARTKPDLVHAMRIPFEGMLAADAYGEAPLLTSVWGNDFTLHAPAGVLMRHYTSWVLRVADGLHADCRRDVRLSRQWGFDVSKPAIVLPGAGGVRSEVFFPPPRPAEARVVVNPRGSRAYVRNDVFLQAIPAVLARFPDARFMCVAQAGDRSAAKRIRELDIEAAVQLLPQLSQEELAAMLRGAQVMVSPGTHDGTPNSLLEAMASGCLPVVGDLESIREWIRDGENGLLADPAQPDSLAAAIIRALESEDLRRRAAGLNASLIAERAEYARCMRIAEDFYTKVAANVGRVVPAR